ncbi:MAG TPA: hypothetical protein VMV79_07535 [Alphaproteobacteria bacterium]|nr:hypothetical protein [Alphaproteobacteria bacterium]
MTAMATVMATARPPPVRTLSHESFPFFRYILFNPSCAGSFMFASGKRRKVTLAIRIFQPSFFGMSCMPRYAQVEAS